MNKCMYLFYMEIVKDNEQKYKIVYNISEIDNCFSSLLSFSFRYDKSYLEVEKLIQ